MQKNLSSYSYATKPKVLSSGSGNRVKQILKTGNVDKVEKIIREGRGYQLIGEFSSDPKIRGLLKSVPFYMARIDMLHDAVTKGQLRDVQILLNTKSPEFSVLKPKAENLVSSKDNAGVGLLHKAIYYDHQNIIEWLVHQYPATMKIRDKMGRIPLHYINSTANPEQNWQLLVENGSPVDVKDANGQTPDYYLNGGEEIHLPGRVQYNEFQDEVVVKPSNLRIWIHDQDIARLREVIWQGHGDKLRTQTSNKIAIKKFLDAVPNVMTVIREIHKAAVENNVNILASLCRPPVPAVILKSKDNKGITALHKACGLGNSEVVDYILQMYPESIYIRDNEGRTAIHYAASFKQELIYEKLLKAGANEHIIDKSGKTAKYYRSKSDDMQDVESLHQLPSSPRTGLSGIDPNFDWSVLRTGSSPPSKNSASYTDLFLQMKTPWPTTGSFIDDESITSDVESSILVSTRQPTPAPHWQSPVSFAVKASQLKAVDEQLLSRSDSNRVPTAAAKNGEMPDVEFQFTEQEYSSENETTNLNRLDNNEKDEFEFRSDSTAQCTDSESGTESSKIETAQIAYQNGKSGPSIEDIFSHKLLDEKEIKSAIANVIKNENLEDIGKFILAGYGGWLLHQKSENRTIKELLNHLPIYLKKIELIHSCCEIGNLEELQKYLDRRKFAIACENKSGFFLTPLHIAVARSRISVVRYLGSRFPETLKQLDRVGRTPLHYAAMRTDGKFIYNMLLMLGADKSLEDQNGCTAQFYYENQNEKYNEELVGIIEKFKFSSPKKNVESEKTSFLMEELMFDGKERKYLVSALGEALKTGLFEITKSKPPKPIKFLADYLSNYRAPQQSLQKNKPKTTDEEIKIQENFVDNYFLTDQIEGRPKSAPKAGAKGVEEMDRLLESEGPVEFAVKASETQPEAQETRYPPMEQNLEETTAPEPNRPSLNGDPASDVFLPLSRDKYGRTTIHLAASKNQNRNSLLQMLHDLKANVAYRDELYRTARDIAALSQNYENVRAIDEYVVHIAANGETDKIIRLLTDGYDHILETETEESTLTVAERRNHQTTLTTLKTIPIFEEMRERLHAAIRQGDKIQVMELFRKCGKDAALMAVSKSEMCRCSLHIAVLLQRKDIVKYLVKKFSTTLHIGDNLERTPLHYAMALDSVEEFSTILIRAGAQRTAKDLKGRQATYYFVNKEDILRMQQEEIYLNQNTDNRLRKKL